MKRLQLKSIFFSLAILMTFAIFMTSCEKQNDVLEEQVVLSDAELSAKLLSNQDFIASIDISNEIAEDLITFTEDNKQLIERQPEVLENFISSYDKNKEALLDHSISIINAFPQLMEKEEAQRESILQVAASQLNDNNGSMRNPCIAACDAALANSGNIAYNYYLSQLASCVANGGDYNTCNNTNYNLYLGQYAIFVNIRNNQCITDCF